MYNLVSKEIVTLEDVINAFDQKPVNEIAVLKLDKVFKALPEYIVNNEANDVNKKIVLSETVTLDNYVVRNMYRVIIDSVALPQPWAISKWERDLDLTNLSCFWKRIVSVRKCLLNMQLQTFYIKFVNRTYYTNKLLHVIGKAPSDKCSFCSSTVETILHLFWECAVAQSFWSEIFAFINKLIDASLQFPRNVVLLLTFESPLVNFLITIGKYVIYCSRLFGKDYSFQMFLKMVVKHRNLEALAYNKLDCLNYGKYRKFWTPLITDSIFRQYGLFASQC